MSITPADIEAQTFPIAFRGYEAASVDAFLGRLREEFGRLGTPSADGTPTTDPVGEGADRVLPDPPADGDPLAEDGGPVARALRTLVRAERVAEQVLADAAADADRTRAAAQVEAGQLLAATRAESGRIEAELRLRSEREVGALADQAQHLRAEIDRLGHLERQYTDSLRALLSEHQRLLGQRLTVVDARTPGGSTSPVAGSRPAA